ncbi:flagellar type III secretion system pore protein FliP [Thermodesulforhabdus norvegica]|uniref:Flagellar biosynthetic protein FliP n=1 Tax=Thermodesulforhabdus norvegica TaxID=39841 RepID=A0A1I4R5A8_9BACT|nr:flagellar type III secretion system pore protein FliP [Thermodesulforhabdus norvegica]SFM47498.1 flagellar biosynthetic protein FliP [Thermodesulforhabdus norvegica]
MGVRHFCPRGIAKAFSIFLLAFAIALLAFRISPAAELNVPPLTLNLNAQDGPKQLSTVLQIVIILTILSVAPAILLMTTSFTRLVIAFSFLRHALGTQQSPPNQVIVSLALFLTFFIMKPVWEKAYHEAYVPYREGRISGEEFLQDIQRPFREFMLKHTREKDLALFVSLSSKSKPRSPDELPLTVVIPAFAISEITTAFEIGFLLYIPFLILDMVVASILLSMGMMMLPPVMISLPFKIMLFVLVDGWNLLVGSLVKSFG